MGVRGNSWKGKEKGLQHGTNSYFDGHPLESGVEWGVCTLQYV